MTNISNNKTVNVNNVTDLSLFKTMYTYVKVCLTFML